MTLPGLHSQLRERDALIRDGNPDRDEGWYRAELKRQPEWEAFVKAGGVEWVRKQKTQSGNKPGKEE